MPASWAPFSRHMPTSDAWNGEELNSEVPADRPWGWSSHEGSGLPADGPPDEQPKQQLSTSLLDDCDCSSAEGVGGDGGSKASKSFQRLLVELAAEHHRELRQLRDEFEDCLAKQFQAPQPPAEGATLGLHPPDEGTTLRLEVPLTRSMSPCPLSPRSRASNTRRGSASSQGGVFSRGSESLGLRPNGLWTTGPDAAQQRVSVFDFGSEVERNDSREDSNKNGEAWAHMHGFPSLRTTSLRQKSVSAKRICKRFVKAQAFDSISCTAIILNSLLLGWSANYSVNLATEGKGPDSMPLIFTVLTVSFTIWFSLELLVRFFAVGPKKFMSKDEWTWNLFDTIVVGSDLVHSILEMTPVSLEGGIGIQNLTVVRMLRVLRITRAIRVVRLVRFFRELRMMVFSVLRSGSSLFWSLLMLSVTIYIFGVYFIQIVAYHLDAITIGSVTESPANLQLLQNYFGNLLRAEYSLYQAVSGGISWGEIAAPLIEMDIMHGFVLCFFTFFTTFALMNIITGIFVDSAIHSAQSDKDEVIQEQLHTTTTALQEMKKIFQHADADGSGEISLAEFEQHLSNTEVRAHLSSLGIETDRAKGLFRLLDLDRSGQISIEEFVYGCMRLKGAAKSIDLATLMYENKRMAEQWRRFFNWSEEQFKRLHNFEARIEDRLATIFGEATGGPSSSTRLQSA